MKAIWKWCSVCRQWYLVHRKQSVCPERFSSAHKDVLKNQPTLSETNDIGERMEPQHV